jgi:hypothetical protein
MPRDVFLSYAHDDQAAARLIAGRLQGAGISTFFDENVLVAGKDWSYQTKKALDGASAVLVLLSSNSNRSTWVQDEVQTALENCSMKEQRKICSGRCSPRDRVLS